MNTANSFASKPTSQHDGATRNVVFGSTNTQPQQLSASLNTQLSPPPTVLSHTEAREWRADRVAGDAPARSQSQKRNQKVTAHRSELAISREPGGEGRDVSAENASASPTRRTRSRGSETSNMVHFLDTYTF